LRIAQSLQLAFVVQIRLPCLSRLWAPQGCFNDAKRKDAQALISSALLKAGSFLCQAETGRNRSDVNTKCTDPDFVA
jgi:hypothetical protein